MAYRVCMLASMRRGMFWERALGRATVMGLCMLAEVSPYVPWFFYRLGLNSRSSLCRKKGKHDLRPSLHSSIQQSSKAKQKDDMHTLLQRPDTNS